MIMKNNYNHYLNHFYCYLMMALDAFVKLTEGEKGIEGVGDFV